MLTSDVGARIKHAVSVFAAIANLCILGSMASAQETMTWNELFVHLDPPPQDLGSMSAAEIETLARYLWIDNATRSGGVDFALIAETLHIHARRLESLWDHFYDRRYAELDRRSRLILSRDPYFKADRYTALEPTAYCGTYTLRLILTVQGCKAGGSLEQEARALARGLATRLPPTITGFKVVETHYECGALGVRGTLPIAFLWRRNETVRDMKPATHEARWAWPQEILLNSWTVPRWNNGKVLRQIKPPRGIDLK